MDKISNIKRPPPGGSSQEFLQYTQQLFDLSLDAIIGMDAHGLITHWNPQAEATFGWNKAEVIGRELAETIIPARYRDAHRQGFQRFIASGQATILGQRIETSARHRDGKEFPIELAIGSVMINGEIQFSAFLRDITGRKRVDEVLQEDENRFRMMFEQTADALLLLDPAAGRFIDCNRATVNMLRLVSKDEIASLAPAELSPPCQPDGRPSAEKASEMIAIAMENGSHRFEWVHCSPYRDDFPVEVLLTPIQMRDRKLLITTWRDISARKRDEIREKFRSETLGLIANGAALTEVLGSIAHGVEKQNPGMLCSILLLDDAGKHLLTGAAPSLPDFFTRAVHGIEIGVGVGSCGTAAFKGERVIVEDIQNHPYWSPYKDLARKARLGACWSEPVFSRQGKVLGTFAIYHREVNRPSESELALIENTASLASIAIESAQYRMVLEQSEARFRLMADSAPVLIWLVDADGQYVWCNKVWLDFTGRSSEQGTGKGWAECVHPDDLQHCLSIYSDHFERRQPFTMEYRLRRHDGEYRWVTDNGVPRFDSQGNFEGYIGSCIDITETKQRQLALRESETKLRTMYESSADALMILDEQGFIDCNHSTLSMFACPSKEVFCSVHPGRLSPPLQPCGTDSMTLANQHIVQAMRDGSTHFEWVHRTFDTQREFPADVLLTTMVLNGKKVVQATVRDISERKLAEEKLQLAASVFTHAREAILITDADGRLVDANGAFTHITGYSREEVLGKDPGILSSGLQSADFYANMLGSLRENRHWYGEILTRRKSGEIYPGLITITAVYDASDRVKNYVALFTDITPLKEHQRQLEHIAHYDALTGLPNRVLLADRLQQAMRQSERRKQSLAVAYLDLDGFKTVNDIHGHDTGDNLLVAISQRMKEALREGDTLARIGGDEFVAVLVDIDRMADCEPVLSRLLQAAAAPVTVGGSLLQVSASIGITLYPQDDADADQLMRHADQAMYVAKQAGKNHYHLFDVHQDAIIKTRQERIEHIKGALVRGEFVLYYQPKVNMKTGEVIGAEALIRWQHPERGLLPPADFLPIIENHPIGVELGEWVIDTALAQMAEWRAAGLDLPISVNVGALQLQQQDFPARLAATLARHPEVKPCWLELEILETSALEDISDVTAIMHACRDLGVHFALDDFGTGFSSLTYLKRLPADLLKIDQTFVRGMLDDPDDQSIVNGIIGLAGSFNRKVIAEGVETIAHGTRLLELGCELAQGYAIARPMPASNIPGWAAGWKSDKDWHA